MYTEVGEKNLSGLSGTIIGKAFAPKDDTKQKVLSSQSDIIKSSSVIKLIKDPWLPHPVRESAMTIAIVSATILFLFFSIFLTPNLFINCILFVYFALT